MSRNNIGEIGGQSIYDSLRVNTRITTCLVSFGNKISDALSRKIEEEVEANNHIENFARSNLIVESKEYGKISIRDKGP